MEIIPKTGKVMLKPVHKETKIEMPKQYRKKDRWGEVVLCGHPLPEEESVVSVGDVVCFNTAGAKYTDDDFIIIDTKNIMLR